MRRYTVMKVVHPGYSQPIYACDTLEHAKFELDLYDPSWTFLMFVYDEEEGRVVYQTDTIPTGNCYGRSDAIKTHNWQKEGF